MSKLAIGLALLCLSGCVISNNLEIPFGSDKIQENFIAGELEAQPIVAMIDIEGAITSSDNGGVVPMNLRRVLNTIRTKPKVIGIILYVNSPGGSGAASEEVFQMLGSFKKETGLPIHAYVAETAASGGYYIAIASDKITANPGAITGSIGVISVFFNLQKLLTEKLEIEVATFKTGKFKDSGSMYRSLRPDEREYWQGMVNHFYGKFIGRVASARKLEVNKVTELADGRVFHADEAKQYGLIDAIGTFDDVVDDMKKASGYGRVKVIHFGKPDTGFGLFQNRFPGDPLAILSQLAAGNGEINASQIDPQLLGRPLWYSPTAAPRY